MPINKFKEICVTFKQMDLAIMTVPIVQGRRFPIKDFVSLINHEHKCIFRDPRISSVAK